MACTHCGREKVLARGLCQPCYHRMRRNGSAERIYVVRQDICTIEGCGQPSFAKNLCAFHYAKSNHPLTNTWKTIRSRYRGHYPEKWDNFDEFLSDVGERPTPKHQLRRKKNSEPWSRENIQWVSRLGKLKRRIDPEYARNWTLQYKYKISRDEYDALFKRQGGGCAICGAPKAHNGESKSELHVDHCHDTGLVRGLLCARCNRGIGYFSDDVTLLAKAIAYLRRAHLKSAA